MVIFSLVVPFLFTNPILIRSDFPHGLPGASAFSSVLSLLLIIPWALARTMSVFTNPPRLWILSTYYAFTSTSKSSPSNKGRPLLRESIKIFFYDFRRTSLPPFLDILLFPTPNRTLFDLNTKFLTVSLDCSSISTFDCIFGHLSFSLWGELHIRSAADFWFIACHGRSSNFQRRQDIQYLSIRTFNSNWSHFTRERTTRIRERLWTNKEVCTLVETSCNWATPAKFLAIRYS